MRRSSASEAAIAAVAKHFGASVASGRGRASYLDLGARRVAVAAIALEAQVARRSRSVPRLRFDRVVLRVFRDLRAALGDAIPNGRTVTVTITAPIRVPARTVATLQERIRVLLGKRSVRAALAGTIHGNQVRARVMKGGTGLLAGFVHNRDSDPGVLFELTQALLDGISAAPRAPASFVGDRWLVLSFGDEPSWLETYGHVCSQLFPQTELQRIVLVDASGRVSPWPG